jgi:hypothetical protein
MTFLEVGRVIGYVLVWVVGVPLAVWVACQAVIGVWNLALALIELVTTLIAVGLFWLWQPIGWLVVWAEGVVSRVRARWAA